MKKSIVYKSIAGLLALLLLMLSITGCSEKASEQQDDGSGEQGQSSQQGEEADNDYGTAADADGRFTLRFFADDTFNPIYCDSVYNDAVTSLMYEGLFRLNSGFEPENVLCESYETEDGTNFYFELISAKMHDGSDLTAEDVAYSINLARTSDKYSARLKNIEICGATEDGRLQIVLYLQNYSLPSLLDIPVIKYGSGDSSAPAGTGAYVYASGDEITLTAFEEYRSYDTLPTKTIYLKEFTDNEVIESFADYSLDLIWEDTAGDNTVSLHSDYETRLYDTAILQYIGFNSSTAIFEDVDVRKAVSAAVNRESIINDIFDGSGRAAELLFNPGYYLYNTSWENGYGYSMEKALEYLETAGLKDENGDGFLEYPVSKKYEEFSIRFIVNGDSTKNSAAAEQIAESLIAAGLNVELQRLSESDFVSELEDGNFDMYYTGVSLTKNFDFTILLGSSGGLDYGKMGSGDYNILCSSFLNATSEANKLSAARNLCVIARENAVIVPVMYRQYAIYTHRGVVENFSPTVSGAFSDVSGWKINMQS